VILIPKKEEYEEAKLIEKLWWSEKDFSSFKSESCQEIREFIAKKLNSPASSPLSSSSRKKETALPVTAVVTSPTGERRLQCSKEDAKKIIRLYFEDFLSSLEEEEEETEDLTTCPVVVVPMVTIEAGEKKVEESEEGEATVMRMSRPRGLCIQLDEVIEAEEQHNEEEELENEEEYEFMRTVLTPATSPLPGQHDFPSSFSARKEDLKDLSSINTPPSDMKFQDHFDEFHRIQQQAVISPPPEVVLPFSPAPSCALRKVAHPIRPSSQLQQQQLTSIPSQQQLKKASPQNICHNNSQLQWFNDEDHSVHSFFRLNFLSVIVTKLMTFGGLYIILNHQRKST
jgi:hypothetical protein